MSSIMGILHSLLGDVIESGLCLVTFGKPLTQLTDSIVLIIVQVEHLISCRNTLRLGIQLLLNFYTVTCNCLSLCNF